MIKRAYRKLRKERTKCWPIIIIGYVERTDPCVTWGKLPGFPSIEKAASKKPNLQGMQGARILVGSHAAIKVLQAGGVQQSPLRVCRQQWDAATPLRVCRQQQGTANHLQHPSHVRM